jgi:hypothetical protein
MRPPRQSIFSTCDSPVRSGRCCRFRLNRQVRFVIDEICDHAPDIRGEPAGVGAQGLTPCGRFARRCTDPACCHRPHVLLRCICERDVSSRKTIRTMLSKNLSNAPDAWQKFTSSRDGEAKFASWSRQRRKICSLSNRVAGICTNFARTRPQLSRPDARLADLRKQEFDPRV